MLRRLTEVARLLGQSSSQDEPQSWDAEHHSEWERFNSKVRGMISVNQYYGLLAEDSELPSRFEVESITAAQRLDLAIEEAVANGDMKTALTIASYKADATSERLGSHHPVATFALLQRCQLLYQSGRLDAAFEYAELGLLILREAERDRELEAAYFCQLLGTIAYSQGIYKESLRWYESAAELGQLLDERVYLSSLRSIARAQRKLGRFAEAKSILEPILYTERENLESNSLQIARTAGELGVILADLGEIDDGLQLMLEALEIERRHLPESRNEVATTLSNLVRVYEFKGDQVEAAKLQSELRKYLSPENPDYLPILNENASRLIEQDQLTDATAILRAITFPIARQYGRLHSEFASLCDTWTHAFFHTGRYSSAKRAIFRALRTYDRVGSSSADHATSFSRLAMVDLALGDLQGAKSYLEQATEIGTSALPQRHPGHGEIKQVESAWLIAIGEYRQAASVSRERIELMLDVFGQHHPYTSLAQNSLAVAMLYLEQLEPAEALLAEALIDLTASKGETHRDALAVASNLAAAQILLHRLPQASIAYAAISERLQELPNVAPLQLASVMNNIGCLKKAQGDYGAGLMTFREARVTVAEHYGSDHYICGVLMQNEAACTAVLGQHTQAAKLFAEAARILAESLGPRHPYTETARDNLNMPTEQSHSAKMLIHLLAAA